MRIGITTNANDLLRRWQDRIPAVTREQRQAAREMRLPLERESQRVLRIKVYGVPIPRSSSGRPLWRRTGNLIGREKAEADGVDVVLINDSDHAEFRLLLGTPYGKPIRSPGIQQVDWQVEAIKNRRAWILKIRAEAMRRAMKGGR